MITSSVLPFGMENSWQDCKQVLFDQMVQKRKIADFQSEMRTMPLNEASSDALKLELKQRDRCERASVAIQTIYNVASFWNCFCTTPYRGEAGPRLETRSTIEANYVDNLCLHVARHQFDVIYVRELLRDFEFKILKKIVRLSEEIQDPLKSMSKQLIVELKSASLAPRSEEFLLHAVSKLSSISTRCVGRVRDLTFDPNYGARTIDIYSAEDFWQRPPEHGCYLYLKNNPAPECLRGSANETGPLGPNTHTSPISKRKFEKLLETREAFVISRNIETGKRELCRATIPVKYFYEIVGSYRLYRGMENYPPIKVYVSRGSVIYSVWYDEIGGERENALA